MLMVWECCFPWSGCSWKWPGAFCVGLLSAEVGQCWHFPLTVVHTLQNGACAATSFLHDLCPSEEICSRLDLLIPHSSETSNAGHLNCVH